jgi:DNA repair protein RadB
MDEKVSTGSAELDRSLEGGYEKEIITAIYGPAGSGKTNLCLLCAASIARRKKVIFIDTEGNFSIERLKQIAPDYEQVLEHIIVIKPASFAEQRKAFSELAKISDEGIGLIVVDTVVMLYRIERGKTETYELNRELGMQVSYLGELARKRQIPVLITSQVYSPMSNRDEVRMVGGDLLSYASKCIIELQKLNGTHRLLIKKHRSLPSSAVDFKIIRSGIEVIPR